jgi:2-methylaconitate cis-trans-isomerase PrpF
MTMAAPEQTEVPCVLMRGGTSKAIFFHEADLPPAGATRDAFLKRAMGTPDPLQIDGLGGSTLSTSKVAIVARSQRDDADVDYTFVQLGVTRDEASYDGNCGNISSAVGPFAIDEGLVRAIEPVTQVRIFNTNTHKLLVARVPVRESKARVLGQCTIAGVPGTGAEILMDYSATVGSRTGRLLPTGNAVDRIAMEDGRSIAVTLCDVANPCVFVAARDVGAAGTELPAAIAGNRKLVADLHELRAKAGQLLDFWPDWRASDLPPMPMLVMVAAPTDHATLDGPALAADSMDLSARLMYGDVFHSSLAGTGTICIAAASRVQGSVVHAALAARAAASLVRIAHPSGVTEVRVEVAPDSLPGPLRFAALGFARTARRLMAGTVFVPTR